MTSTRPGCASTRVRATRAAAPLSVALASALALSCDWSGVRASSTGRTRTPPHGSHRGAPCVCVLRGFGGRVARVRCTRQGRACVWLWLWLWRLRWWHEAGHGMRAHGANGAHAVRVCGYAHAVHAWCACPPLPPPPAPPRRRSWTTLRRPSRSRTRGRSRTYAPTTTATRRSRRCAP